MAVTAAVLAAQTESAAEGSEDHAPVTSGAIESPAPAPPEQPASTAAAVRSEQPTTPVVSTTTIARPGPTIVANPRAGDLRVDPAADTLPVSYHPAPAVAVRREVAYGEDPAQRVDLHLPEEQNAPVVVYLHAGGWVAGAPSDVPDIILRFLERGYAVASVGYRLAPRHRFPAPGTSVDRDRHRCAH